MTYLDSSALVKLAINEAESVPLVEHLTDGPAIVSSALARTEMPLAVRGYGPAIVRDVREILDDIDLMDIDDATLDAAAELGDVALRTLDAIHVATAISLGEELTELITYDRRMADAATALGLRVASPA